MPRDEVGTTPTRRHGAGRSDRSGRDYHLALFGVFGSGNFGNDATLDACLAGLEGLVPRSRIVCIATGWLAVSSKHDVASSPFAVSPSLASGGKGVWGRIRRVIGECANFARAWRLLRRVRSLVIAGTGVLDDQHTRPNHLPLDIFRWSLAARLAGARVVFFAAGAGPIDHPLSRILLVSAARLAHDISYRDQRAMEFMRSLGRDVRRDRVVPDIVLGMPTVARVTGRSGGGQRRLALGVLWRLNWDGRPAQYRTYEDRIVALIVRFAAEGWRVALITGDEADTDALEAVRRRPELSGLPVEVSETHAFSDVLRVASGCDAMIASRYHNVVGAILAGIPVVSLGYGPKNLGLLELLGAAERAHDIDSFDVGAVSRQILGGASTDLPLYGDKIAACRSLLGDEFKRLARDGQ